MLHDAKEISAQLASVEERIREVAFGRLCFMLPLYAPESYKTLCIGLYYYYWYCDGTGKQAEAACKIACLESSTAGRNRAWRDCLISVIVKFWDRLDYHRTNKYLNLFREIFHVVYETALVSPRRKEALKAWNEYLRERMLGNERAKPLLLELIYVAGPELLPLNAPAPLFFLFCKPFFDVL